MDYKILEIKKNKVKLQMDDGREEDLYLSPEIISKFSLKVGIFLDEASSLELAYKGACNRALFLLAKRDYSRGELKTKLLQNYKDKGFFGKSVDRAIDWADGLGYISDLSFTIGYINAHKKDSKKKIIYNLRQKKVSSETIKEAFLESDYKELDSLLKAIDKVKTRPHDKQISSLLNKGYNYGEIKEALRIYEEEGYE